MTNRKTFLQQSALALAGSCLPFSKLFAKEFKPEQYKPPPDTYHPKDCIKELSTEYQYSSSDIQIEDGSYAKNINGNTIKCDKMYAGEEAGFADDAVAATCPSFVEQCENVDIFNENPFRYRVYYPKTTVHDYVSTPLPVYVFFHAGGYQECSNLLAGQVITLCDELSRKGFICFSVEYRRGRVRDEDSTLLDPITSVQQQLARYRAIQDGCGFIRTMIKRNRSGDDRKFNFVINEDQVFIGGSSAGGIIALACAYYRTSTNLTSSQTMIDQNVPKATGSTYNMKDVLGNMHTNLYYGDVDPQYWPKIAGVASLWGGIIIPKIYDGAEKEADGGSEEAKFFASTNPNDNPPLIAFHGYNDKTVPFKDLMSDQNVVSSSTTAYKTQGGSCQFYPFSQKSGTGLKLCSSLNMYYILKRLNRFVEFYTDCSMGHGLDENCAPLPCTYGSNFGSGAANVQETLKYIAARIAVFSHAIMNSSVPLGFEPVQYGRSYFKDCKNTRKCTETGTHSACTVSDDTFCDSSPLPQ